MSVVCSGVLLALLACCGMQFPQALLGPVGEFVTLLVSESSLMVARPPNKESGSCIELDGRTSCICHAITCHNIQHSSCALRPRQDSTEALLHDRMRQL
jgi:hypothetical protein